jgi:hypothetical protein
VRGDDGEIRIRGESTGWKRLRWLRFLIPRDPVSYGIDLAQELGGWTDSRMGDRGILQVLWARLVRRERPVTVPPAALRDPPPRRVEDPGETPRPRPWWLCVLWSQGSVVAGDGGNGGGGNPAGPRRVDRE